MADHLSIINSMISLGISSNELELMYPSAESRQQTDLSFLNYAHKDRKFQPAQPQRTSTKDQTAPSGLSQERKPQNA